ncbi:MAG: glycosyltransferase [Chloroflexi bacterium]|nr:glycosyltransferase [Chloroflexota bacterium]
MDFSLVGKQLRLALLSVHSCPVGHLGGKDTGGMNVYVRELARELGKQGHLVDVYTRIHDRSDSQIVPLGENARLVHLKAGALNTNKLAIYAYLPEFACNVEHFRKDSDLHYDMVFSHYWLSGWVGKTLCDWWGIPHMLMFHTTGAIKNTLGLGEDEPELRIETERYLANNCQRIIAATEYEKQQLAGHYGASPDTISVIPCGVNLDLFQPMDKQQARQHLGLGNGKIVLFVGRIEALKGIDSLVRAMSLLKRTDVRLIVIGGDARSRKELSGLKKLAHDLGIAEQVEFLGLVKQEKLPYFYSAADVCVVCSHYESFGLVALEALACGTPVVSTRVGDIENIIQPGLTGYVVDKNLPEQLAEKIAVQLANNSEDCVELARGSVARFSWSNIADRIAAECHNVLSGIDQQEAAQPAGCCRER